MNAPKIFFLALVYTSSLYAEEFFIVQPVKFEIMAANADEKLEQTLKYPENLLKRFKPEGAIIDRKKVSNNAVQFRATKKILFVSKTVQVNGILDVVEDNSNCNKSQQSHKIVLNFEGSDELVVENISRLEATLCTSRVDDKKIVGVAKGRIYKGSNYSNTLGYIARGIVEAQVGPLMKALSQEIQSMK